MKQDISDIFTAVYALKTNIQNIQAVMLHSDTLIPSCAVTNSQDAVWKITLDKCRVVFWESAVGIQNQQNCSCVAQSFKYMHISELCCNHSHDLVHSLDFWLIFISHEFSKLKNLYSASFFSLQKHFFFSHWISNKSKMRVQKEPFLFPSFCPMFQFMRISFQDITVSFDVILSLYSVQSETHSPFQ